MAKDKNEKQAKNEIDLKSIAHFLPEGMTLDDFEVIGGLRPICAPEINQGNPIGGYIVAELPMPPRKDGSAWNAILLRLATPAKAKAGEEIIVVEPGKDVLLPVSGNLKANSDLRNYAADPHKVYFGVFTVVGEQDVGKPSPMHVYDVRVVTKKPIPRDGSFALYNKPAVAQLQQSAGEILGANGQPAGNLFKQPTA